MTITVSSTAPVGTHSIKVTVTGAEGQKVDGWFMLTVTSPKPSTMKVWNDKSYPDPYHPKDIMTIRIQIANPGVAQTVNFAWLLFAGGWFPVLVTPLPLPASYDGTLPIPIPVGEWGGSSFDAAWVVALLKPLDNNNISLNYCFWRYEPPSGTGLPATSDEFQAQVIRAAKRAASDAFPT